MSSGSLPTYTFRPPSRPNVPVQLRGCSSKRARLWAGGTYFRVREPGLSGNNISVEVFEYTPYTGPGTGEAYCVVTNQNLKYDENVKGPIDTTSLNLVGTYADLWIIEPLNSTPHAKKYSISLRIAFQRQTSSPVLPSPTDLGEYTIGKLFVDPGKLSVKTVENGSIFTPTSAISIAPRTRIYQLSGWFPPPPVDPLAPIPPPGWDIANLRSQINANDPWIEMLERSGPIDDGLGGSIPNPNPPDVQDEGTDSLSLTPFAAVLLAGGDGLPDNPVRENTGPSRSIVHVNYGELQNGSLGEHNTVYEWAGDSASAGSWIKY